MTELTIVAVIVVKPNKIIELRPLFDTLIKHTTKELGCVRYDLHHDNEDPSRYLFYEIWETRPLWQVHMASPHLLAFQQATSDMIVSVHLSEMTKLARFEPNINLTSDARNSIGKP